MATGVRQADIGNSVLLLKREASCHIWADSSLAWAVSPLHNTPDPFAISTARIKWMQLSRCSRSAAGFSNCSTTHDADFFICHVRNEADPPHPPDKISLRQHPFNSHKCTRHEQLLAQSNPPPSLSATFRKILPATALHAMWSAFPCDPSEAIDSDSPYGPLHLRRAA